MPDPADFAFTPPDQGPAYRPGITAGDAMAAIGTPRRAPSMPDTVTGGDQRMGDATYRFTGSGLRGKPIATDWQGNPVAQSSDRT